VKPKFRRRRFHNRLHACRVEAIQYPPGIGIGHGGEVNRCATRQRAVVHAIAVALQEFQ